MQGNPEAIILLVHTATFGGIYAVAWWPSAATAVTQNLSPSTEEYILNKTSTQDLQGSGDLRENNINQLLFGDSRGLPTDNIQI